MKDYDVTYKANGFLYKDIWAATSAEEAEKKASSFYRRELTDFVGIINVEEH